MNQRYVPVYLVAGLVMSLALLWPAQAGEFDSLVKVSAKAAKPGADGKQTVTFTFAIEKGWYIYANPVGDKNYEANRTSIAITAKEKLTSDVQYPSSDQVNKYKHRIYEKEVVIKSQVQRAAGDASPLEAKIEINVCSHAGVGTVGGVLYHSDVEQSYAQAQLGVNHPNARKSGSCHHEHGRTTRAERVNTPGHRCASPAHLGRRREGRTVTLGRVDLRRGAFAGHDVVAWCAYQATLWSGVQTFRLAAATKAGAKARRFMVSSL